MSAAKVTLNVRIAPELAEALDAEARRSGRTKTEIVVAALTDALAKEATQMTISAEAVRTAAAEILADPALDQIVDAETIDRYKAIAEGRLRMPDAYEARSGESAADIVDRLIEASIWS